MEICESAGGNLDILKQFKTTKILSFWLASVGYTAREDNKVQIQTVTIYGVL